MTRRFPVLALSVCASVALATSLGAENRAIARADKRVLTLDGARLVAAAAEAEARRLNTTGAIAVVDDGGNLLHLVRLDNTFPAGSAVAIEKARTAATFRQPTRNLEDAVKNGRTSLVAVAVMTPLAGGVPLVVDGQIVGAVGVSGAANAAQDEELATVAASATARFTAAVTPAAVTYLPANEVRAGFAKGAVLVNQSNYMVHASRRDAEGQVEIHDQDTDIIYMLEGTTTLVTGGTVVGNTMTAADEWRGASVTGGESRVLRKGDVVVVPRGTPHWFQKVEGPVLYYVVKVR
jgi:glc operon protein GlcG